MVFPRGGMRGGVRGAPKRKHKLRLKSPAQLIKEQVKKLQKNADPNEEISSDSDEAEVETKVVHESSDDDEKPFAKQRRLAKKFLEEIEQQEKERAESDAIDRDAIALRLKEDVLEQAGKIRRNVADFISVSETEEIQVFRGHRLAVTCLVLSPDDEHIYSASKDSSIIKWCLKTGKRLKIIPGLKKETPKCVGHSKQIMSMCISSDNKFLASGCKNKIINIWNPETMELIHTFKGHRDVVSGLVFRKGTHQLYSASHDRAVKIWNLDEMSYVETLFGHQDAISAIDALSRERAITSGGRDDTVRIWKIVEESQLVFNGHVGSIDCVRLINEEHFISCGDDGMLALWGVLKKKPLASVSQAHGIDPTNGLPNWISALAALTNSNLCASGSCDGYIRLWKCGDGFKSFQLHTTIPIVGHVNALQFASDGKALVAGIGQENRLGRWFVNKEAKNSIIVIPLNRTDN